MTALFAYGFRPFFLLAGAQAIVAMAVWLAALRGMPWPAPSLSPFAWHAHEMLFGFVAAAIAGFLLTAVPSWTGRRGFAGPLLMVLVGLWLAGRVVMAPGLHAAPPLAAVVDLAFLPAIAIAITPSLVRAGNLRNLTLVGILALLLAANLLFHFPGLDPGLGPGLRISAPLLAIDTMLLLVSLIGGRVTPAFTGNALRARDPGARMAPFGWVDRLTLAATAGVLIVDLAVPGGAAAGGMALVAGVLHAWRLGRWRGWRVRHLPIAWVLHLAYGWIAMGLGLKALWLIWQLPVGGGWQHALTAGAFATMIIAVMTRAALGHTGRAIVAARPTVLAYGLITLSALVRVFGPPLVPGAAEAAWIISGILWIGAFSLFGMVYFPILTRPRADGRPG